MAVIKSMVDTKSDAYKKNVEVMSERVGLLKERLGEARESRSEKAKNRLAQQNKLSVRERLDLLLDRNTPFLEMGALAAYGQYDGKVHGAGSVMGIGVIHGREVMVHANDPTIKGGTVYPMGVKKTLRCQAIAMENRLPTVYLIDSGGAFLPLQSEVFPDIDDGGRVFYNQAMMSKMGIPQITSVMGLCTAGAAYIPAMSDEVVHVKGTGAIFLGGPPLVKAATGEVVSAEELGGADLHCRESGVSDYQAENDAQALAMVRESIRQLPGATRATLTMAESKEPLYDPEEIYGITSHALKVPYDVREIIARLVDGSDFHEFKPLYGATLVCGFAHVHGYPVGILGNNGILFSESALKATQFIQLCDRRGIPLVFLQNINGYIIGKAYEAQGITKDGHKMVNAVATATVPKFTIMVGASFGAGNYGMCGRAYSPRLLWSWPSHEIGVMGGEQASDVLVTVKNEQLAREGLPPLTEELVDQIRVPVMEAALKEGDAYYSTSRLWDDGIIDPKDTRTVLALSISAALNAPLRDDKEGFGVFRM